MLSLARRPGQKIRIGENIVIVVREVRGRQVKLGIEAPAEIRVLREEIHEELCRANQHATGLRTVPDLLAKLPVPGSARRPLSPNPRPPADETGPVR